MKTILLSLFLVVFSCGAPPKKGGNAELVDGYAASSMKAVSEIRSRGERLSELNCKENITHEELVEEYKLSMPPRVNHNIVYRCAQLEDLEMYTASKERSNYYYGPGKKVKVTDAVIDQNNVRLKEGSYKPQLYVIEGAKPFVMENTRGFSPTKLYYERTEACLIIYGKPASRNLFSHKAKESLYCGMEVLSVSIPSVVYRRNHYGNFYEYDYTHIPIWEGRDIPEIDTNDSWGKIVGDKNPSRFPFVWRAEMKVRLKTGVIAYLEWDWVEDGMPDSKTRKDPRWTVSSMKPDQTRWVSASVVCSTTGNKVCSWQ